MKKNADRFSQSPKIAYILEGTSSWIISEIKALEKRGVKLLICLMDWSDEKKLDDQPLFIISASPIDYFRANWTYLLKLRSRYFRIAYKIGREMGWRLFFRMMCFAQLIVRQNIKHIHAQFAASSASMAMTISEITGIPFSFSVHAYDIFKGNIDRDYLCRKIEKALFIRCISDYNREYLLKLCPATCAAKISVLHCGIDVQMFGTSSSRRSGERFTILSVSNLVEKKGLSYLVEACRILRDRGYDFNYLMVGDGPEKAKLESLITAYQLSERIHIKGWYSHKRLPLLFQKVDVFVLPCIIAHDGGRDGIPVALMEPMAMGVPVISTDISGIPELVENMHTGLLVPQKDAESLAKAIERLIEDEELRRKLGKNGIKKVREKFDIERIACQLTDRFLEYLL